MIKDKARAELRVRRLIKAVKKHGGVIFAISQYAKRLSRQLNDPTAEPEIADLIAREAILAGMAVELDYASPRSGLDPGLGCAGDQTPLPSTLDRDFTVDRRPPRRHGALRQRDRVPSRRSV